MTDDLPEIKTGNGVDRDLAATANDRLKKTVTELRGLKAAIGSLNENLVRFSNSSDKYSKRLIHLTWVLVVFTIVLVFLTFWLIKDAHDQTSSQNNIALNSAFYTPENEALAGAIERGDPILQPKGKFTTDQLDTYLGTFDTIDSAYKEGLLSKENLCISFSYYIQRTATNHEVQKYVIDYKLDVGGLNELSGVTKNCPP